MYVHILYVCIILYVGVYMLYVCMYRMHVYVRDNIYSGLDVIVTNTECILRPYTYVPIQEY